MLDVKSLKAKYLSQLGIEISWEFEPSPLNKAEYLVTVFGGFTPEHMKAISSPMPATTSTFIHGLKEPRQYYQKYYYSIQLAHKNSPSKTKNSDPVLPYPPIDPITAELINKEELKLRLNGIECAIYVRLTEGMRCIHCWDEVRHASLDKKCKFCLGTGFKYGYHPPMYKSVNINFDVHSFRDAGGGSKMEDMQAVAELGPHPQLTFNDLIVEEHTGNVWRLVAIQGQIPRKKRFPTKQMWGLVAADKSIIEDTLLFKKP